MRTRQQAARRKSQRQQAAEPTRRSQRLAERKEAQSKPAETPAQCSSELQAAMAKSRAQGRRRNAVVAENRASAEAAPAPVSSRPAGLWDALPPELLDVILDKCTAKQLAMLETSCSFFKRTKMIQTIAESRLRAIPRAKGTVPDRRCVHVCGVQRLCVLACGLTGSEPLSCRMPHG